MKGPDNPTCQLLPTSSQRKVKMGQGRQERDKRNSEVCEQVSWKCVVGDRSGVCVCEGVQKWCVKVLWVTEWCGTGVGVKIMFVQVLHG